MMIYFEHIEGSRKGQVESFDSERIRIGRQADNDLRFDPEKDKLVSGHHAEIAWRGDGFLITDLQSKNGTFINGHRITQPVSLADGDIVQFSLQGPKVVFLRSNPAAKTAPVASGPRTTLPSEVKTETAAIGTRGLIALISAASVVLGALVYAAWTSRWALFAALLVCVVVVAGGFMIWWWLRWRRAPVASPEITSEKTRPGAEVSPEGDGLQELRRKWSEGLATLRKSKLGQRGTDPTYAVPWLLVLGEPGSGKTETIRAANPLPWLSSSGRRQGLTGTRNCDWWFFDKAVFIDTAGRYVFPAPEDVDGAEWRELLSLLRRSRPQEPVNGVIAVIAADALASRPLEKLQEEASQIRRQLDEMSRHLGATFPVYLLVTKMDLISGFAEFCGGLPEANRGQAMGAVNDDPDSQVGATAFLDRGFGAITERLDRLRLARMDEESDSASQRRLFLFPEEFRCLRGPLRAFVTALFRQSPYQETPLLRGLFFTSARQGEGSQSRLSQAFGFSPSAPAAAAAPGTFFVRDIFTQILSQDRALVGRTAFWRQRYHHAQVAAFVAVLALCLVLAGILTLSFFRNRQALSRLDLDACLSVPGPAAAGSLGSSLKGLDACREAIERLTPRTFWGKAASDFGLGQSERVAVPLRQRYLQDFRIGIAEPLEARIDQRLASGPEAPPYVGALIRRINLLARCRAKDGCPLGDASVQPSYRVLLTAASPDLKEGDPRVAQLARTDEAYLRWQTDARSFEEMHAKQVQRVMRWLQSGGLRADWILASASSQFPAIRTRDFWGVDTAAEVSPAYTQRAWTEGIQPLLAGLKLEVPEAKEVRRSLERFEGDYRSEFLRQWERFLTSFPQSEKLASGRTGGKELAVKVLGPESPYRRVIDVTSSNLTPVIGSAPQGHDVPSWAVTLQRYAAIKAKTPDAPKSTTQASEESKAKTGAEDRELLGYVTGYLDALDQLRGELSTPERAFKAAQKALEEGEASDRPAHLLQKAIWNREQLRRTMGSRQGEDRAFWILLSRPVEFAWRIMLDQAGLYLQGQWEALRLEIADLPPGPRTGKVLGFVNGPAAPFLERRRDVYSERTFLNDHITFTRQFLEYLARSQAVSSEVLGKLELPRQIVAPI